MKPLTLWLKHLKSVNRGPTVFKVVRLLKKRCLSEGLVATTVADIATVRHRSLLEKSMEERSHILPLQIFNDKKYERNQTLNASGNQTILLFLFI